MAATRTRPKAKQAEEEAPEVEETEEEATEASNGDKPKRDPSEVRYTLFTEDSDGVLTPLGDYPGRNAKEAVKSFTKQEEQDGAIEVVVIPKRNMTHISVKVETTQKLRFD
jgi:hypothetical protein